MCDRSILKDVLEGNREPGVSSKTTEIKIFILFRDTDDLIILLATGIGKIRITILTSCPINMSPTSWPSLSSHVPPFVISPAALGD